MAWSRQEVETFMKKAMKDHRTWTELKEDALLLWLPAMDTMGRLVNSLMKQDRSLPNTKAILVITPCKQMPGCETIEETLDCWSSPIFQKFETSIKGVRLLETQSEVLLPGVGPW